MCYRILSCYLQLGSYNGRFVTVCLSYRLQFLQLSEITTLPLSYERVCFAPILSVCLYMCIMSIVLVRQLRVLSVCLSMVKQSVRYQFVVSLSVWSQKLFTHTHLHLLVRDVLPAVRAGLWSHRALLSLVLSEDVALNVLSTLSALDLTKFTFAQVFLREGGWEGEGGREGVGVGREVGRERGRERRKERGEAISP